ncbi:protein of unknown function [Candidatus Nitrosacidococcus tergens]|uniref:Uncharacterized protein n=1 Tax=Candidatus Nitrosacidococcus tergens TaxID=553981 RepID=A0A7G1QBQ3_9GAMM|nr:protein of unknown function [Candidatus Nitrosacidococcus tergens]
MELGNADRSYLCCLKNRQELILISQNLTIRSHDPIALDIQL